MARAAPSRPCSVHRRRDGGAGCARAVAQLGLIALLAQPAVVAAAPLRVGSPTVLSVTADARGRALEVRGELRDAVGRPLAGVPIAVELDSAAAGRLDAAPLTDDDGAFVVRRPLPEGDWRIVARFDGDEYLGPSAAELGVRVEAAPLAIDCAAPAVVGVDVASAQVRCEATLDDQPWPEAALEFEAIGPATVARTTPEPPTADAAADSAQDESGGLAFALLPGETRGAAVAVVRAQATEVHDGGEATVRTTFAAEPALLLAPRAPRLPALLGPAWSVDATLTDRGAPVVGARLIAVADGRVLSSAVTDAEGRATLAVDLVDFEVGDVVVDVVAWSDEPDAELVRASAGALRRGRTVTQALPWAAAVLGAALATLLVFAGGGPAAFLPRRAGRTGTRLSRPAPVAPPPRRRDVVQIVVADESTGAPIGDATLVVTETEAPVRVDRVGQGVFALPALPTDAVVLATAPGYSASERHGLRAVAGDVVVVRLRRIREHVRDQLHAILDALDEPRRELRWGRATVSALRRLLAERLRALRRGVPPSRIASEELEALRAAAELRGDVVAAAEALVLLLDAAWWGGRETDEVAREAERLAEVVLAAIRERT